MLILVRHGSAGDKSQWPLDDVERPLSARGWQQADGLVRGVSRFAPTQLWSSPYRRCRQTLAPLSERTGLDVEIRDFLGPSTKASVLERALVHGVEDRIVVATHGETLRTLLRRWDRTGAVQLPLPRKSLTRSATEKGAGWIVVDDGAGPIARYLPPLHGEEAPWLRQG